MGFVSHALTVWFALQSLTGQRNFDITLRFDLNAPCESANISLTAFARFAQRTGVFALVLVALVLSGSFISMAIMCAAVHSVCISRGVHATPCHVSYILNRLYI